MSPFETLETNPRILHQQFLLLFGKQKFRQN